MLVTDNVAGYVLQELADVKKQLEVIKQDIADLKVSSALSLFHSLMHYYHAVSR